MPWRVAFLDAALDSLIAQRRTDFDVHLYIPHACRRTGEAYVFPPSLRSRLAREPRIRVRPIATDYGPATKFLGPYDELRSGALGDIDAVITADDDVLLERHAVEELVEASTRLEDDVLGFMGVSEGRYVHAEHLAAEGLDERTVSILGGYRAVLYPVSVLDQTLLDDYRAVAATCDPFLDDDHLASWNLARRGVVRRVIATAHPGPEFGLNATLLDLPGSIGGDDQIDRSHKALIAYYDANGWPYPR